MMFVYCVTVLYACFIVAFLHTVSDEQESARSFISSHTTSILRYISYFHAHAIPTISLRSRCTQRIELLSKNKGPSPRSCREYGIHTHIVVTDDLSGSTGKGCYRKRVEGIEREMSSYHGYGSNLQSLSNQLRKRCRKNGNSIFRFVLGEFAARQCTLEML